MNATDLQHISQRTLAHYNQRAQAFWEGTRDHDVSQNIDALLRHIQAEPPFTVLDFGCGPGRDLMAFTALGHHAIGLEGSHELAALARQHSGCEVLEQNFLTLDLPAAHFDGVFANAVLFHVPGAALAEVLAALWRCLKPGGVLFSSNPRGDGREGICGDGVPPVGQGADGQGTHGGISRQFSEEGRGLVPPPLGQGKQGGGAA